MNSWNILKVTIEPYPEVYMAKRAITFTQARIRDLPIPDSGCVEYYDTKKTNLMCRVSSMFYKVGDYHNN